MLVRAGTRHSPSVQGEGCGCLLTKKQVFIQSLISGLNAAESQGHLDSFGTMQMPGLSVMIQQVPSGFYTTIFKKLYIYPEAQIARATDLSS